MPRKDKDARDGSLLHEKFAMSEDPKERYEAARYPGLSGLRWKILCRDKHDVVRLAAQCNPGHVSSETRVSLAKAATSPALLSIMASDPDPEVLQEVVWNTHRTEDALRACFTATSDPRVQAALLEQKDLPSDIVTVFARSKKNDLCYTAIYHAACPMEVLQELQFRPSDNAILRSAVKRVLADREKRTKQSRSRACSTVPERVR